MSASTNTAAAPVVNLRETRKEQAAAKAAAKAVHPAGTKKATGTTAETQPTEKAATTPKIRWLYTGKRGEHTEQVGTADNGSTYRIVRDDDGKWTASVTKKGGRPQALTEKPVSVGAAYSACMRHIKSAA